MYVHVCTYVCPSSALVLKYAVRLHFFRHVPISGALIFRYTVRYLYINYPVFYVYTERYVNVCMDAHICTFVYFIHTYSHNGQCTHVCMDEHTRALTHAHKYI
jgi:hypothetical protein